MVKKQRYILYVDAERCDGCRRCEMMCSLVKTKNLINPVKSRIRVLKREVLGIDVPIVCRHCEDPLCRNVCPVDAILLDEKTGAVLIIEDRCIGCRECMLACPFGAISFDVDKGICVKCDLCGGVPACVEECMWNVLNYVRADLADQTQKRRAMERLQEAIIRSREITTGRR